MKLGRPRCYTIYPHKGLLGGGGSFHFAGSKNYRHVFALAIISCTVVLYQISVTAISSSNPGNKDNLCEFCGYDAQSDSYANSNALSMGTGAKDKGSYGVNMTRQQQKISSPEEPSANSNYYEDDYISNNSKKVKYNVTRDTSDTNNNAVINKDGKQRTKKLKVKTSAISKLSKYRQKLLDSIFLSVKTTKRFHETRLKPILQTWFNLARDQTWIFTDGDDPELDLKTNGHIINTHCPSTHYRQALCCKMSVEFDTFLQSKKSWFCHFDDDNYVNVPALVDLLAKYDHRQFWYLGKPSLKSPIRILDPDNKTEEVSFWFATGGAGFCLSRALALRFSPLASGGKFIKLCDKIQLPDDVTVGYTAGHLLGQNLTIIPQLHSHFETMKFIDMKNSHSEITFSYVRYSEYENILDVKGFSEQEDPTRFLSLHCLLFPNFSFCSKRR